MMLPYKNKISSLIFLSLIFLLPTISSSYFQDYCAGVRPTGMGKAFVAVADDIHALYWNSAGLANLEQYEIMAMYSTLFTGLEIKRFDNKVERLGYSAIAGAVPLVGSLGSVGLGWTQFKALEYQENTMDLSYANNINLRGEKISLGVKVKLLNWLHTTNKYTKEESKLAATADLAMLYPISETFSLGMSFENLIPAELGVTTSEKMPRIVRLGFAWKQKVALPSLSEILISTEYANRNYSDNQNVFALGMEAKLLKELFAIRLGANSTEITMGLGGKYALAVHNTNIKLDYAFSLPWYVKENLGMHRLALTIAWK